MGKEVMKLKNRKGFSLVELLAVIVIVGILATLAVVGVTRYLDRARAEKVSQNRKNVAMAAQLYLQSNRDLLPKNIGEAKRIPLSDLRSTNYLKEDVTNDRGEDCMENSVVRVYKYDDKDYSYTTYLYCGNDVVPAEDPVPVPAVENFAFSDKKHKSGNGDLSDVRNASFSFTIKGAKDDDTVGIYSYRYVIYVKKGSDAEYTEIFNSEYLKGGLEPKIEIASKSLSSYVDLTGYTMFLVKVDVLNEQGGKLEWSSDLETTDGFEDNTPPICGNIYGDDKNNNDWINKATFAAGTNTSADDKRVYPGRVSVECSDGAGSGCKRELFTKTWPNNDMSDSGKVNYKYGARWGYITISDNAVNGSEGNNVTKCYVRVNVDLQAPTVTLYAYNAKTYSTDRNDPNTGNVAKVTAKDAENVNGEVPNATIKADDYKNNTGVTNEKWLNLANYPEGLVFDADVTDNLYLDRWTWEVNDAYVAGGTSNTNIRESASAANVSNENGSKVSGNFSENVNNNQVTNDSELVEQERGDVTGTINGVKLYMEGKRYGKLTVYDKAGNMTIIHVYANLDRTAPPVPEVSYAYQDDTNTAYYAALPNDGENTHWINHKLYAYIKDQKTDAEGPNNTGRDLSGWDKFVYKYKQQGQAEKEITTVNTYTFGLGNEMNDEGKHTNRYYSCDKAGNCSGLSRLEYIKIDLTKPTCGIKKTYNGTTGPNGAGWLKEGQSVLFEHTCQDDQATASKCNPSKYQEEKKLYDYDINTTKAGVKDDNKGGYVYDYAGNRSDECPKNETVKIDTKKPTCNAKPTYSGTNGPNSAGWLKIGESVTVSIACDDALVNGVASGCDGNNESNKAKKVYDYDINTTQAGPLGVGNGNGGKAYDIAGNVSDECGKMTVKIDHKAPTCTTSIEYGTGKDANSYVRSGSDLRTADGWLGLVDNNTNNKKMAKVSQVCTENPVNSVGSGCAGGEKSYIYASEINTTTAGAGGSGNGGGKIYDVAGNGSENCPTDKTVRIDYTAPTCTATATTDTAITGTAYNGNWTNKTVFLNGICNETGNIKSGCKGNKSVSITADTSANIGYNTTTYSENARVYDAAGNYCNCNKTFTVRVDKTPAVVQCSLTNPRYASDNDNNFVVDANSSYDKTVNGATSGIKSITYSLDGGAYGSNSSKKLTCQTNQRTATASVKIIDNAGNEVTGACGGSVVVPGCCQGVDNWPWQDGTTCTQQCGWEGTFDRHKNSPYNGQVCVNQGSGGSACNRRDCCSSVHYSWETGCSRGCGGGTKTVYNISNYNGQSCPQYNVACNTQACINKGKYYCQPKIGWSSGKNCYFWTNSGCEMTRANTGTLENANRLRVYISGSAWVKVWFQSGIYVWNGTQSDACSWTTYWCSGRHCTPCGGCSHCRGACT